MSERATSTKQEIFDEVLQAWYNTLDDIIWSKEQKKQRDDERDAYVRRYKEAS